MPVPHRSPDSASTEAEIQALRTRLKQLEQAERELQATQELLRAVLDETPDYIVLKDRQGKFLLGNRPVAAFYGTTPEEMIGKDDSDFSASPAQMADIQRSVMEVLRSGQTQVVFEESTDDASGEVRFFKSIKKPFLGADGEPRVLVIAHDITDIRQAQARVAENERRLDSVLDSIGEAIWDWCIATGTVIHNGRWYEILGYMADDLSGSFEDFVRCVHPEDVAGVKAAIEQAIAGDGIYRHAHRMLHKNGNFIWVLDRSRVVERDADGRALRMVGSFADISEQRRYETQLREARQTAEAASRAKSDFLAHMSHEIRTPMNGIIGLSELALTQPLPPRTRDYLEQIHQSGRSLLGILNDILDQAKIEAGHLELVPGPFELATLLQDLRNLFSHTARAKGLKFDIQTEATLPSVLIGDALRLQQVLANLLSNAIKFTRHGHVELRLSDLETRERRIRLRWEVEDTGIGMDGATLQRLFKPFTQGDSSIARRFGGTGLGLSISRDLVALMGGTLHAESTPEVGSRFYFDLDLEIAASAREPITACDTPADRRARFTGARLLVAEDHPVNQRIIGDMLRLLGLQARMAANGREAIEQLEREPFDAVLMDVQMPELDGLAATRLIRDNPRWRDLPIIALTAGVTSHERERITASGMDGLISKPVTIDSLAATLAEWLPTRSTTVSPGPADPAATHPATSERINLERLSHNPVFDLSQLSWMGDEELTDLLASFHRTILPLRRDLDQALDQNRLDRAKTLMHNLKGMAGNFGALRLSSEADRLDQELAQQRYSPDTLAALYQALAEVLEALGD
ncbi:MAG: PAS domain S-box protein [Chromatiaceae bacterium]|nr:PAS domain S-box protein [Chromatiaceae bacterium]